MYIRNTMLRSFQVWQMQERLKLGDQWHDSGRIFTAWDGRPIHPDTITNWFHRFLQDKDLPSISIHSLRHTNATLMIAAGINLQTVSKRLGHANVNTTGMLVMPPPTPQQEILLKPGEMLTYMACMRFLVMNGYIKYMQSSTGRNVGFEIEHKGHNHFEFSFMSFQSYILKNWIAFLALIISILSLLMQLTTQQTPPTQ